MVIPEFGNALPQLEHNTADIVGPEAERIAIRGKFCHGSDLSEQYLSWIAQWLEHQTFKLEARFKAWSRREFFSFNSKIIVGPTVSLE